MAEEDEDENEDENSKKGKESSEQAEKKGKSSGAPVRAAASASTSSVSASMPPLAGASVAAFGVSGSHVSEVNAIEVQKERKRQSQPDAEETAGEEEEARLHAEEEATLPPEIAAAKRELREAKRRQEAEEALAVTLETEVVALDQRISRLSGRQNALSSFLDGSGEPAELVQASDLALRAAVEAQAQSLQARLILDDVQRARHQTGEVDDVPSAPVAAGADVDGNGVAADIAAFRATKVAAERERTRRAAEREKQAAARAARRKETEEKRRAVTAQFEAQRLDVVARLQELELAPPSDRLLQSIFDTVDQRATGRITARELKRALGLLGYEDEKDARYAHGATGLLPETRAGSGRHPA